MFNVAPLQGVFVGCSVGRMLETISVNEVIDDDPGRSRWGDSIYIEDTLVTVGYGGSMPVEQDNFVRPADLRGHGGLISDFQDVRTVPNDPSMAFAEDPVG